MAQKERGDVETRKVETKMICKCAGQTGAYAFKHVHDIRK